MWPAEPVGFREAVFKYHAELLAFSRKMTRIFALALNLDEHAFDEFIKVPDANLRLLHYPHQEASRDDQNGLGIHTDFTWFTIIAQDTAGGLEVLHESGEWIEAEPIEGTLVMNIADCFMRQTNDYFISTPHRVINKSGMARYSAPFLFGFNLKTLIQPITTCVSEDNPNKYTPMTAEEYFVFRGDIARATESEQYKNKV
jgi:isopenicillin N synthase-like dioxygenase